MTTPIRAAVSLESGLIGKAGADRIALLEAIDEHGSISAAAKSTGLSYRAAWDAVQVLNNLFAEPLVTAVPGGAKGGGAAVTAHGRDVVAAFRLMEAELGRILASLQGRPGDSGPVPLSSILWALGMKISTRNALRGVVAAITDGAVNAEVVLQIGPAAEIVAVITRQSVEDLGLAPGREAFALINPSFIILAAGDAALRTSARNTLAGTVIEHRPGAVNDEVTLEIDEGKTVTATITSESAKTLGIGPGARVTALIKASHVILAAS
jgi:molybdate transport system regulatory protein